MPDAGPRLLLIDGHSLIHRAFYALPALTNTAGQPTGAVYGFINMLLKVLEEEEPRWAAVAFDLKGKTFRHEAFEAYKAHRPPAPDELVSQVALVREVLAGLRIPIFQQEGYEADDVLGTLASRAAAEGAEVVVVTGDRDALQLVGPGVQVLITRKGITDMSRFDEEAVRDKYGVTPRQLIDVKGLMGDPSDNIPGVPGIGEKTALSLVKRFGSLEEILSRVAEVSGKKVSQSLREYADQARLSRRLAAIETLLPMEIDWDQCQVREPDLERLKELFGRLEFRSLLDRLAQRAGAQAPAAAVEEQEAPAVAARVAGLEVVESPEALARLEAELMAGNGHHFGLSFELVGSDSRHAALGALALSDGREGTWLVRVIEPQGSHGPEERQNSGLSEDRVLGFLAWLGGGDHRLVVHDAKPFLLFLGTRGMEFPTAFLDTALAAYLLDPSRTDYPLEALARNYVNLALPTREEVFGQGKHTRALADLDDEELGGFLAAQARAACLLWGVLAAELEAMELAGLYEDVELPLVPVLARMQANGVLARESALDDLGKEFSTRIAELTGEIHGLAGEEFNINSPQQLGEILFKKLDLPVVRKTKTGYSTDAEVLEILASEHNSRLAARVLEYRQLVKLQGTYVDGLRTEIDPETGRIHTSFNQMVTATGRLSSAEPNLQNIPVRLELGRRLRRAFVAPAGSVLLAADYSQIELRVLAHMSGDDGLIDSFRRGEDIHRRTAAEVFGLDPALVDDVLRNHAKAVNFGIVYGISDFGLARNIGIPRAEAKKYIDGYFKRYPGVKAFIDRTIGGARRDGYVRTMFGRIRYLPELKSRVWHRRQFAERAAMNTPIQGTAADIIKLAMLRVQAGLDAAGLKTRMVLQVHDELVFECPLDEIDAARRLVIKEMEGAARLEIPLRVEVKVGTDWYDMKRTKESAI